MPNKHFCQGPFCHEKTTQDRFLKSRGVVRGRYALWNRDTSNEYHSRCKYFCSTACESEWLNENMENIEQGRSIEFIRHRRETGGYEKVTDSHTDYYGNDYKTNRIELVMNRVDND